MGTSKLIPPRTKFSSNAKSKNFRHIFWKKVIFILQKPKIPIPVGLEFHWSYSFSFILRFVYLRTSGFQNSF